MQNNLRYQTCWIHDVDHLTVSKKQEVQWEERKKGVDEIVMDRYESRVVLNITFGSALHYLVLFIHEFFKNIIKRTHNSTDMTKHYSKLA